MTKPVYIHTSLRSYLLVRNQTRDNVWDMAALNISRPLNRVLLVSVRFLVLDALR